MDYIILAGIVVAAIGLLLLIVTTKYTGGPNWGYPYRTTNKALSALGWLFLIIGLVIIVFKAKLNGQLD
ncbi:hypothetical protein SAMN05720606_1292 [Paenibacillus polysaccharolyticus]|uniref:Uncharacterized protein n=1 Tax=Paenibacillus polysaccharolyticus TaxID=582692 RepID=A0A1G5LLH1_9BACL|nr:hypothetical protein [Paenibacillus polysaccharolyticus]SCZ13321.1 hypothetical protein SAMN05720606_1292 [Paenibacillus polysaccharolyticus]